MARIRTIKPEFPQSESLGRISRDARLTFVELWTIADDSGRLRGSSRMLASLLFPYDDDAPKLMDNWLGELEREKCIKRYVVDGQKYIQVTNWFKHQKIDKPSPSRLPAPENIREDSRGFGESSATPREDSSGDLGPRTMDLGVDQENTEEPAVAEAPALFEESADDEFPDDIPFDLPDPTPPPAPKPKPKTLAPRDPLRDALAESFKAKVPEYASPAKENANLLKLTSAIRRKASSGKIDEMVAAQGCIEIFWRLHESGKQFYADFTPSKMLAAFESLWAEYLKSVEANDLSWIDEAEARCAREGASA